MKYDETKWVVFYFIASQKTVHPSQCKKGSKWNKLEEKQFWIGT